MTEELNLSELFSNFVNFVARNSRILIMIVLITVIGVVAFQKLKPTVYETKAICMSGVAEYERQEQIEDLSQRTAIDLVNFLKINIDNEDYQQLSDLLGVDMEIAKSVKGIEAEQLYQQDMDEKFYALNKFEVTLVLSDNSIIEDVQDGLIYYFNNNKFIMSYYEEYKKSCNNLINDINSEIESLASFREQANSQLSLGLTNTLAGKNKSLSNEIIALSHVREDIIINKKLLKPLVFVQDFAKVEQKEDDVLLWGLLGGVLSFILGLFIALVKEVKTR
ncbi:MAG: hypothetical protein HOB54_06965 [Flavobacteriales bacterium]|jgi:hypothetical protein|nr:hypothetical protein [Flavobacteriales bacterium]